MPNVYQPGLLQIRPQYDPDPDTNRTPENVLWFQSVTRTTPTLPDLTNIAHTFDIAWGGSVWLNVGAATKHYTGCVVVDWSSNTGLEYSSVGVHTPDAGLIAGESLPPAVSVLTSIQGATRYRGGHSRSYSPWVGIGAIDTVDPKKLKPSPQANMEAGWGALTGAMSGSGVLGGQLIMIYRFRNNPIRASLEPVVDFVVQPILATQRRRQRKAPHH